MWSGQLYAIPVNQPLDVTIAVHERRWHDVMPGIAVLAEQLVRHSLAPYIERWQKKGPNGYVPMEVACILTDDREIHDLNLRFRGKDSATNVLSFVADPEGPHEEGQPHVLGDIILSLNTLEREAKEQSKNLQDHVGHMIVHGVLHLLGFDHRHEKEAELMEGHEIALLEAVRIGNPYDQPPAAQEG